MGSFLTNPPTIPNTDVDSWQPLVERDAVSYYGLNRVTLTNWDGALLKPLIAQGSVIDIDGSLATFIANEAIGGSPADGEIWLKFVVSGSTVTAEFTAEAPTWYADKGGWYNAVGERYSAHVMTQQSGNYSEKRKVESSSLGQISAGARGDIFGNTIETDNVKLKMKYLTGTFSTGGTINLTVLHGIVDALDRVISFPVSYYQASASRWVGLEHPVSCTATAIEAVNVTSSLAGWSARILVHYRDIV